jgi:hypothetical protein
MSTPAKRGAIELLQNLEEAGALTETALLLTDPNLPFDRYEALGHYLGRMNRSCSFWIGDWLNFGEHIYGETMAQAAEGTGLAPQTLANRMSVCRHIPPERRRAALAFGVHAEVAYLEPKERDAWLDRAEEGQWTRAKLREEMRALREEQSGGPMRDLAISGKIGESREEHPEDGCLPHGDFLGEPESDRPTHTCPQCGCQFQ